jgi:predicted acetyltransferase
MPNDQSERIELVSPTPALKDALLAMLADFEAAGEPRRLGRATQLAVQDFDAYLRLLEEYARGVNLPTDLVPQDTYWLVRDGTTVLGTVALRHYLTPALEDVGGHIGYNIRPSERRKGYGARILAIVLERARARGLDRVLLTCDTDNIASARIIEKNGGVLASQGVSPISQTYVSRYWIAL